MLKIILKIVTTEKWQNNDLQTTQYRSSLLEHNLFISWGMSAFLVFRYFTLVDWMVCWIKCTILYQSSFFCNIIVDISPY